MKQLEQLAETFLQKINFNKFSKHFVDHVYDEQFQKIATKVQIINNTPIFTDPTAYHGRYGDLKYLINRVCREYGLADCSFIVLLGDCYGSKFPCFSTIRPHKKDIYNIPIPMGNCRGLKEGWGTPIKGWDQYIEKTIKHKYPWNKKINKAVFRGQYAYQTWKLNAYHREQAKTWTEVNRGRLYQICENHKDLFDVGFNKVGNNRTNEKIPTVAGIPFEDQQAYKYIISVGTNANWAERLRTHLFTSSLLVKHEAECVEWFYPLMKPWVDYIPFNLEMSDLIQNIKWAQINDFECEIMVQNANEIAKEYLNEKTMVEFTSIILNKYILRVK